jgi:hypothetical protein
MRNTDFLTLSGAEQRGNAQPDKQAEHVLDERAFGDLSVPDAIAVPFRGPAGGDR